MKLRSPLLADLVFHDLIDPVLELEPCVRGKNEPSFCVVPIFLSVLPSLCILSVVIIRTKLLASDTLVFKLVLRFSAPIFVSDGHCMSRNDFSLLLWRL